MNVTPRQLDILRLIRDGRRRRGYSPTMQEMGDALGIAKTTAMEHVEQLIRKGLLVRTVDTVRGLSLADGVSLPDKEAAEMVRDWLQGMAGLEAWVVAADEPERGLRAGDYLILNADGMPWVMLRRCA